MHRQPMPLAALAMLLLVPPAHAACNLALTDIQTASWNGQGGGYDAFDATSFSDLFTLEVLHTDPAGVACDVVARVEPFGKPDLKGPGQETLVYQIRTASNQPVSNNRLNFSFTLEPGERRKLTYAIRLPSQQSVSSGNYDGRLQFTAFEDVAGALERRDNADTPVRARVASAARIAFVGAVGRKQEVDFGELTDRKRAPPVFLDVRSTSNYRIRLKSENGGNLEQIAPDGRTWSIDYETILDGRRVDLSASAGTQLRFDGPTPATGDRLALGLQIGDVGDRRAGTYRDRITIEITPGDR